MESMWEYEPLTVYNNLIEMTKYRNIELKSPVMAEEEVIKKLNHNEYIIIDGVRSDKDIRGAIKLYIILIAPNSDFAGKTASFKEMMKVLPKNDSKNNVEIMIISENGLTIHIKKYLAILRKESSLFLINEYNYEIFTIEIPKYVGTSHHEIMSNEEVEDFCSLHNTDPNRFPEIREDDPYAVWIGLRPGMVVRVHRISDTAGKSIAYRYCIK